MNKAVSIHKEKLFSFLEVFTNPIFIRYLSKAHTFYVEPPIARSASNHVTPTIYSGTWTVDINHNVVEVVPSDLSGES